MKTASWFTVLTGVFAVLVLAALATDPAVAAIVVIEPGSYSLGYRVSGGDVVSGTVTVDLAPGTHEIDNGAGIEFPGVGSSRFLFTVTEDGRVTDVRSAVTGAPSSAAAASSNRLVFQLVTIHIEPGRYQDDYLLQYRGPELNGAQSVVVVPDLVYQVDELAHVDIADGALATFYFVVDAAGEIRTVRRSTGEPSDSAAAAGTTVFFNR